MSLKKVAYNFQFEVNLFLNLYLAGFGRTAEPNLPSDSSLYRAFIRFLSVCVHPESRVYLTNNKTHFTQPTSLFRLTYYEKYSNVMFLNGEKTEKIKLYI